ncbi:MAG: HepT-like ribonuclease domain-containing protein [Candidatus Cryptobacteroides sp.]|jgi:uncharacterized protein with HEPN domain|nr:HepT-like ribonuclease domain-containing protein [Candidatus Cryptobacteroides sp.]
MDVRLKANLYDIQTAISEIYSFFEQVPKQYDEYQRNLMLRRAVERNIGIIGEATNRIVREHPEINISYSRAIIATRNRVIHDYAAVTDDVMWKIVINDLPKLKEEVDAMMAGQ